MTGPRQTLHRASEGEAQHYQWYGGPAMGRVEQRRPLQAAARQRGLQMMRGRVNATIFTAVV